MSEHLRGIADIQFTIAGFFIFFALFLTFVALTFLPSQKRLHTRMSHLPLENEKQENV